MTDMPTWEEFMIPTLRMLSDGVVRQCREFQPLVAYEANLTRLSNDEGIDGVIDQDILGLNRVHIQAKRYADGNVVGRPHLEPFVGALSGKADSGVFITTSRFSEGAQTFAENVPTRIILIDDELLTSLMIRYGVGGQVRETYKVDEDLFV
jgi:restriction system protein